MLQPESTFIYEENYKMTDILYDTVSQIKNYSLLLREESDIQNQNLKDVENQMNTTSHLFKKIIIETK